MESVGSPLGWAIFGVIIVVAMAIDLGVAHRGGKVVKMKDAAIWVGVWTTLAIAFNIYVYQRFGSVKALEFTQGWLLELALSVDNVFVFIVVFTYFRIPPAYQHRVLFWGILGAVVSRGIFIVLGAAIIERFHWVMYILGAFLVYTGFKIFFQKEEDLDPSKNPFLRLFRRLVPMSPELSGHHFVTRIDGRLVATPLLAVLVVIEGADVMFAIDSIPAVFGVTKDVFIVYTSNIFAILGLRSMFFLVGGLMEKLRYLKLGVAVILAFIGVKILLGAFYKMPVGVSLGVLAGIIATSAAASLLLPPPRPKPGDIPPPPPPVAAP